MTKAAGKLPVGERSGGFRFMRLFFAERVQKNDFWCIIGTNIIVLLMQL